MTTGSTREETKVFIVLKGQLNQVLLIDEPAIRLAAGELLSLVGEGAQSHEQAKFFGVAGGSILAALDLDLHDWRLEAELVFVGDDIDAAIGACG